MYRAENRDFIQERTKRCFSRRKRTNSLEEKKNMDIREERFLETEIRICR